MKQVITAKLPINMKTPQSKKKGDGHGQGKGLLVVNPQGGSIGSKDSKTGETKTKSET